jgi:hypothetical protein
VLLLFFHKKLSLLPMYYCVVNVHYNIVYTVNDSIRKYTGGNYPSYQLHLL